MAFSIRHTDVVPQSVTALGVSDRLRDEKKNGLGGVDLQRALQHRPIRLDSLRFDPPREDERAAARSRSEDPEVDPFTAEPDLFSQAKVEGDPAPSGSKR